MTERPTDTASRQSRILIVDDDPDIIEVIRGVLEDQGMAVDAAADGREALALAERQTPDLVVLDVTLPVLSSSHVAGYMRALNSGAVPLLVITADGHAREKATQLGAYTYLRKPFELTDLLDAVWRGLIRSDRESG